MGSIEQQAVIVGPFYHGTKADLKVGDLISPGYRSNYGSSERTSPWVYMTATLSALGAELARGDGPGRLYIVEPTGAFVDDPDLTDKKFPGNPTKSYRSRYPLRVVGEVTEWEPHPPELIQSIKEGQRRLYALQAERIARIPSESEFERIREQADALAHEWTPAPRYVGCVTQMLITATEVQVCTVTSFASEHGDTRTFALPHALDVRPPSWPPVEGPHSGRITDVDAWRDGWAAVIESCVTEIGLSLETRLWVAPDADHSTLRFRVEADGPERSWQRSLQLVRGVLTDAEYGEIWNFQTAKPPTSSTDTSAGYEAIADEFRVAREYSNIGAAVIADWARTLPANATVLDLGCGTGVPVSDALAHSGCAVWGIDASPTLVRVFSERFPHYPVVCEDVMTSTFFGRRFDAVIAVGLLFLFPPDAQRHVILRVADALLPDGVFLFTASPEPAVWDDVLTGRRSESLGAVAYRAALDAAGFSVVAEMEDEGENHYFVARYAAPRRAAS